MAWSYMWQLVSCCLLQVNVAMLLLSVLLQLKRTLDMDISQDMQHASMSKEQQRDRRDQITYEG